MNILEIGNSIKSNIFLEETILQLEKDFTKILNFLYRIDLSEDSERLEMQNISLSFTEMLSNMIEKRELKKLILKNYHTGY
tara:strand:- start:23 stop:265 length:243 start_codon:yes stop_codon:yes gene_type:complete